MFSLPFLRLRPFPPVKESFLVHSTGSVLESFLFKLITLLTLLQLLFFVKCSRRSLRFPRLDFISRSDGFVPGCMIQCGHSAAEFFYETLGAPNTFSGC